jgi:hypothetical protein
VSQPPVARRLWVPQPVTAVPVRIVLDGGSELDALEETLLGLLRIAPQDARELTQKLRISRALALSALATLADRAIVTAPEEPGGLYRCAADVRTVLADAARPGWAFYASSIGGFVATVVVGERLPSIERPRPEDGVIEVEATRAGELPRRTELVRALQALLASRDPRVLRSGPRTASPCRAAGARPVEVDGEPLPELGDEMSVPRLRSVVLDAGRQRRTHVAWVPIDLLPRMRGRAVAVFHEPVIDPSTERESPIAPDLGGWLKANDPAVWSALEAEREGIRIDVSLVLSRAGIDSLQALDAQVDRRLDGFASPPGDDRLIEKIREAERWLILAQREPLFRAQARDAWAHAIEELGAVLAALARPHLERWKRNRRHPVPTEADAEQRLRVLGLRARLGPSERHLRRAVGDPGLAGQLDRAVGAGAGITLWLLPMLLLDEEAARRYAGHVRISTDRHPQLFEDLDKLVAVRNYTFHEGRTQHAGELSSGVPELAERLFMDVFATLKVGLEGAPIV